MDQRIVEILMYVIGEIQSRRIRIDEIDGMSDELVQRGFSQREVATAFSLFTERLQGRDLGRVHYGPPLGQHAHRVLHEVERQYVSPEALGYVFQLTHLGILTYSDVEDIIERCIMMGNLNVGGDEMKMLVATHLLEKEPAFTDPGMMVASLRPWPEHVH
jgi:uncharacterized protein Smg (DUF494 family)